MKSAHHSFGRNTLQNLTTIKRPDVPPLVALRNTVAVILPLAIGLATGHTELGLGVAAGALNTMFSDQPGPYRQRISRLLLASLAAALAALTGFLVGQQLVLVVLATLAFGFFGGMLVLFGTDIARVGMTSMIVLVITAAEPATIAAAFAGAASLFAGGLLLGVFSIAAWPLQRYGPERAVLATVYRGLSSLTAQQDTAATDVPTLSDAMNTLQQTLLGRHQAQGRAMEAFGVLLELAERMRLEWVALQTLYGSSDISADFRARAAEILRLVAQSLDAGDPPKQAQSLWQSLQADMPGLLQNCSNDPDLHARLRAFSGQIGAAVRNANWAGSRGEVRAAIAEAALPKQLRGNSPWFLLRAGLTPKSVAFRHAVRTAVTLSMAIMVGRLLQLPHAYWLPMTVAIVLRADFAATLNFGLLRVIGTLLGLLLTTVLLHITPALPWAHLALMAILCLAFRYLATAHYGIAVAALTGTVVILLSFEGVDSATAVTARVINTIMGCGVALLAYVAWPTWERGRVNNVLADMLDAYTRYLHTLIVPAQAQQRWHARTAARTARSNALASIDRLAGEPGSSPALILRARAVLANGNRLARTAMTLEAILDDPSRPTAPASLKILMGAAEAALQSCAEALRGNQVPSTAADLRDHQQNLIAELSQHSSGSAAGLIQASDRLVDNVHTLAHVIGRSIPTNTIASAAPMAPA